MKTIKFVIGKTLHVLAAMFINSIENCSYNCTEKEIKILSINQLIKFVISMICFYMFCYYEQSILAVYCFLNIVLHFSPMKPYFSEII
jgi:hypothetical protein